MEDPFFIWKIVFGISSLVLAVSLHEMMHAVVGYLLGDDTAHRHGRITLNPFAHIHIFFTLIMPLFLLLQGLPPMGAAKPVPLNPHRLRWGEFGAATVALAGPLSNFLLAFVGAAGYHLTSNWLVPQFGFAVFVSINLGLGVFNLLPIPPLDGSRVVYVFMPDGVRRVMRLLEGGIGVMIALLLILASWPLLSPALSTVHFWLLELLL